MDKQFNADIILEILREARVKRRSYMEELSLFLDIPIWEIERQYKVNANKRTFYKRLPKPPREERLLNILRKRYNVPEALIQTLIEEYESQDW